MILSELAAATARRKLQPTGDLSSLAGLLKSEDPCAESGCSASRGSLEASRSARPDRSCRHDGWLPAEVRSSAMQALARARRRVELVTLEILAGDSPDTETRSAAIAALATLDVEVAANQCRSSFGFHAPGR